MKIASLAISALLIAPTYSALSYDTATQPLLDYQKFKVPKDGYKKAKRFSSYTNTIKEKSSNLTVANSSYKKNVLAENIEFTVAEITNNQFTIIDNGNESALPYFGTAMHFNADNTGIAGFEGSSFFMKRALTGLLITVF
ncbi:hypothetical protein P20652_1844 [Pseudoalteromonas sp. BSi20652]|uniref:hypothetical protein n=1 Tax=Pseudoalteromonas sp. BSi20652 TaxID=388384 RepID=UPI0002318BA1|nr:hypothetical protein [Pseudoalteromonas sp. BSi20652]GAA59980.1 hypothetical protein P20652_1844 [Pseudoalteromonas sp. BSi20652]